MSETDAYRSAVLPSEAAMIPAAEVGETPPPAAEEPPVPVAAEPPQRASRPPTGASRTLERLRASGRGIRKERLQWMDAQSAPLGGTVSAPARPQAARPAAAGQPQIRQTTSGGAALSTLMRSAARRYMPPPAMRLPPQR